MPRGTGTQIVRVEYLADQSVKLVTRKSTGELHEEQKACHAGRGGWQKARLVSMIKHSDGRFRGAKIERFNKKSLCQLLGLLLEAPSAGERKQPNAGVRRVLPTVSERIRALREELKVLRGMVQQQRLAVPATRMELEAQLSAFLQAQRAVRMSGETQSLWWAERLQGKHKFVSFVEKAPLTDDPVGLSVVPPPSNLASAGEVRSPVNVSPIKLYHVDSHFQELYFLSTETPDNQAVPLANMLVKERMNPDVFHVHRLCFEALYGSLASKNIQVPYQFYENLTLPPKNLPTSRLYLEPAPTHLWDWLTHLAWDRWLEKSDSTAAQELTEGLRIIILSLCHTLLSLSRLPSTRGFYHFTVDAENVVLVKSPTVQAERLEFPEFGLTFDVPAQRVVACLGGFHRSYLPTHVNNLTYHSALQRHVQLLGDRDHFWDVFYLCHSLLSSLKFLQKRFAGQGRKDEYQQNLSEVLDFLGSIIPPEAFRHSVMYQHAIYYFPAAWFSKVNGMYETRGAPDLFHHTEQRIDLPDHLMMTAGESLSSDQFVKEEKKLQKWYLLHYETALPRLLNHAFFHPFRQRQESVGNVWVGAAVQ